jgi:hypothetical protein
VHARLATDQGTEQWQREGRHLRDLSSNLTREGELGVKGISERDRGEEVPPRPKPISEQLKRVDDVRAWLVSDLWYNSSLLPLLPLWQCDAFSRPRGAGLWLAVAHCSIEVILEGEGPCRRSSGCCCCCCCFGCCCYCCCCPL